MVGLLVSNRKEMKVGFLFCCGVLFGTFQHRISRHGALIVSPAVSPQSISCGLQASGKDSPNGVLQVSPLSSLPSEHLPADPVDLGAQPQRRRPVGFFS